MFLDWQLEGEVEIKKSTSLLFSMNAVLRKKI
jgi:hypothetical protein